MTYFGRPAQWGRLDRRTVLIGLGVAPVAVGFLSCAKGAPIPLTTVDMGGSDPGVRPQDDLYRHVNGSWLRDYQLPPDKASFGSLSEVSSRTEQQLREIVEGIKNPDMGSAEQQTLDLYDAQLDIDEIERLGLTPLAGLFAKIDGAATRAELGKVMAELPISGLIGMSIEIDRKNSSSYIPSISQSGLGLGEQYYRKPEHAAKLAGYHTFLERIATGANLPAPVALAQRVIDLEKRIATAHWDNVRNRDTDATYNLLSWDEVKTLAPQFDWESWLSGNTDRPKNLFARMVVNQPSFIIEAGRIWADSDIELWRDYLRLSVIREYARCLPTSIADADFDFFGKLMEGLQERPEPWKLAIATVNSYLGEQLGKLYVDRHFSPLAKERVREMVADLMTAYRDNFTNSTWMSQSTKVAAIAKLDKVEAKVGYPDKWSDYSKLDIIRGRLIESLLAVNETEVKRDFSRLGTPVDKSEWGVTPQTVNAYYIATANQIIFPAAILQPPYFDKDAEPAVNFGGIGAVIGHEVAHGFDNRGFKYDGAGNRRDWWPPEDLAAFEAKTARLVEQYNPLVPEGLAPEQHVRGELTVSENLADLRGLEIALAAFGLAEKRRGVDAADYRSVFLSWARIWRVKRTEERAIDLLATDMHAPSEFRCNQVVRNIDAFYRAFDVREGDKLFLSRDQRLTL
ncbi:M13 family metallopeptidase [Nocardia brasiliensis]|uniref:M13 family metallopeptidase n=1 Tax=Nocardia brasiliensis TaxID=37326 RepID=UPI00245580F9|nr:M13 family metallopeptidase [Nocardia brasiliensis]